MRRWTRARRRCRRRPATAGMGWGQERRGRGGVGVAGAQRSCTSWQGLKQKQRGRECVRGSEWVRGSECARGSECVRGGAADPGLDLQSRHWSNHPDGRSCGPRGPSGW
eukprot:365415-Chlamydomonas_euryale.AAC.4